MACICQGHDASWGFGYPWLTTPCWGYVSRSSSGVLERSINVVSMNPTLEKTLTFVDGANRLGGCIQSQLTDACPSLAEGSSCFVSGPIHPSGWRRSCGRMLGQRYIHPAVHGRQQYSQRCGATGMGKDPWSVHVISNCRSVTSVRVRGQFTKKIAPIVGKYGRRPVFWEEAFESGATAVRFEC